MQAVLDGVDIISLSVGPNEPTEDTLTFLNMFDISLLFARKAGVFVVQAAGNKGPTSSTVVSFSPWSVGVAACNTNRRYRASILLLNGQIVDGVGLSGNYRYPSPIFFMLYTELNIMLVQTNTVASYFSHAKYFFLLFPNIYWMTPCWFKLRLRLRCVVSYCKKNVTEISKIVIMRSQLQLLTTIKNHVYNKNTSYY